MSIDWSRVKESDVKEACSRYDADERLPKRSARNTFLILDGRRYPAKFIRGLAYEIATGDELNPNADYTGGVETLNFFRTLGFTIEYNGAIIDGVHKPNAQDDTTHGGERTVSSPKTQRDHLKNLLEQRFGSVETEAKFDWLTVPDQTSMDGDLKVIHETLVSIRGYNDFSTPGYRLACDFFAPSKNLIIEYDERQHFTIQRAESLSCYPSDLYVGFDIGKWRKSCESIRAVDTDPIYRDEQRAFYDSTRDILAVRNGMTLIRLKHGDVDWNAPNSRYELDRLLSRYIENHPSADLSSDIRESESIGDDRRKDLNGWVATVTLQSNDKDYSHDGRMAALSKIVDRISKKTSGDGVILFPGGWFYTDEKEPRTIYTRVEPQIKDILGAVEENIIVCIGIDGSVRGYLFSWDNVPGDGSKGLLRYLTNEYGINWANDAEIRKSNDDKTIEISKDENSAEITIDEGGKATLKISDGKTHDLQAKEEDGKLNIHMEGNYAGDQIGLAVDRDGIKAIGRKFHPAPQEKGHIKLADDYLSKEGGKSRIFELNGVKYFMCVCYDTYGIRHKNIPNPGVDIVLNLVHSFYPAGEGSSGTSYFAKHGFAGASKQWDCPVFGAVVFFRRNILQNWPTGVYWNQGSKSTTEWRYVYNPLKDEVNLKEEVNLKDEVNIKEDLLALIRIYDLKTMQRTDTT